ncbi:MAG: hypothetical protein GTO03_02155, partial [Planctomycetales bacterium]|nr:hypothetical protein [Planctomycetales bacterium]
YDVPRWLNEGLAQVFESGLWEAGVLRLDAPDPALLAALQADLQGAQPLPLGELLAAPVAQFLVRHGQQAGRSHRLYLYSWGLAYYLIFEGRLLDSAALEHYLGAGQGQGDPQARFEALVKMPLGKFQAQWRAAMVGLGP